MNGDGLRAPLGTGAREPTPWFDRAIGGGGLRARTEPGETDPRTCRDPATGDGWSRSSTEKSYEASVGLLAEDEELSGRQRAEQQATASAAQPHPPPEPPPAAPPTGADAGAGDMSGDAATSHRTAEALRALQSLELAGSDGRVPQPDAESTREYVTVKMFELRASSGTWTRWHDEVATPDTAIATKILDAQGGLPKYADFASVPPQHPFTDGAAHDAENNATSAHGGLSQINISHHNAQPNSVHHNSSQSFHYYNCPAAAPPAAAPPASAPTAAPAAAAPPAAGPPSSVAQQLADVKAMFEQGLIPSREIYEAKVRHILGLP